MGPKKKKKGEGGGRYNHLLLKRTREEGKKGRGYRPAQKKNGEKGSLPLILTALSDLPQKKGKRRGEASEFANGRRGIRSPVLGFEKNQGGGRNKKRGSPCDRK